MSETTRIDDLPPDELLAAEYALGLLEGETLLRARGRLASEPGFAALVARWEDRLAPLMDEIGAVEPSADLWPRIEAALAAREAQTSAGAHGGAANVVPLEAQLTRWKWATGIASAAAAIALAFLVLPDPATPPDTGATPGPTLAGGKQPAPLFANVPIEGTPLSLDLTYLPDRESLLVTAIGLAPDGVHDHELWLVPPEGELISLGVVTPGEVRAHEVPESAARVLASGSELLLTREPLGGKPEGQAAGPVVAQSAFSTI